MTEAAEKRTIASRYATLKAERSEAEVRAKRCAKVTLPRLWVEEGAKTRLPGLAYSDTGPKCVNTLASKISLSWMPPNLPPFRLSPGETVMAQLAEQAGVESSEIEVALAEVERVVVDDMETSGLRAVLEEGAKHCLVTGNFLLYDPDGDEAPKLYPLTSYVVVRDGLSNVMEMITKDMIAPALLPEGIREQVQRELAKTRSAADIGKDVELYTQILRAEDNSEWRVSQEVAGVQLRETEFTYPIDACPWIPVAAPRSLVDDYGEGLIYDYVGAFESLEELRRAVRKGAAAMAKILFFIKNGSTIRRKQLTESESGDVLSGDAQDVTTLQLQKSFDLSFARQEAEELAQKLEVVFGVKTAIQRKGERVTAYEWAQMSQELDNSLSGFMALSNGQLLLPLIRRRLDKLQRSGRLPEIPPELLKPRVTVGIAALGRGHDLQNLLTFGQALDAVVGAEVKARRINESEAIARIAAASGVSIKGLIKSEADMTAEAQNQATAEAMVRAAPTLAGAMAPPQQ